jgi:hypothetical protein
MRFNSIVLTDRLKFPAKGGGLESRAPNAIPASGTGDFSTAAFPHPAPSNRRHSPIIHNHQEANTLQPNR